MTQFEEQDCVQCSVKFCVPVGFTDHRRRDKRSFWCPNGHSMSYTESEADRLKVKLQAQEQATANAKAEADRERKWRREEAEERKHAERRLAAQKGVTTRLKNRVGNGVCPCCNRTFANLARHMAGQHKGFVAEDAEAPEGQTLQ